MHINVWWSCFYLDFTNDAAVVQFAVCVMQSGMCHVLRIADLKVAAQRALSKHFLRLIAPDGRVLNPEQSLEDVGLQEGDTWLHSGKPLKSTYEIIFCRGVHQFHICYPNANLTS